MILSFMKINTIILFFGMMSNSSNTYIKEIDNISNISKTSKEKHQL